MRHSFSKGSAIATAAAAKLCFASAQTNAAVIYTDIADVTLNTTTLSFDIDADSFDDINISHSFGPFGGSESGDSIAIAQAGGENGSLLFLDASGLGDMFSSGDLIDGSDQGTHAKLADYEDSSPGSNGNFLNVSQVETVVSGFIGFELASGNLGWMELDVAGANLDGTRLEANSLAVTVKSFAYEDNGQAIRAGQTVAVPAPSTWALLAVGAFAGLASRRKRPA
jgi:hypothetical protein